MTRETKRQQLSEVLRRKEPIWKDEDRPELKDGAAAWVCKLRQETEARMKKIQQHRDRR